MLQEAGVERALRDLGVLRPEKANPPLRALSMRDIEEFCVSFLREIRSTREPPSDATLERAVRSLRRAAAILRVSAPDLPRSFVVQVSDLHPLTGTETGDVISECADQLDRLRQELRQARNEQPIKRWFRLRWKLFAKQKTGRTLPGIGEMLFEMLFSGPLAAGSYERMLRRDEKAIEQAKRIRTEHREKQR